MVICFKCKLDKDLFLTLSDEGEDENKFCKECVWESGNDVKDILSIIKQATLKNLVESNKND